MSRSYFLTNGILYLIFTVLCTVRPAQTARGIGYDLLSAGGKSEYLVIYGGLQLGLALFYFVLARDASSARLGMLFSLLLYASIVIYRLTTLAIYRPSSPVTLGTAGLETGLLIWALVIWRSLG